MSHHDHDAGLVHDHGWACSDNTHAGTAAGGAEWGQHGASRFASSHAEDHHGFDDGLVHDHSWARS